MIRPATLADIEQIIGLLKPYMEQYPLREDRDKTWKALVELISGPRHFAMVSVRDNTQVEGVLLAGASDNMWAQRQSCNVFAWISKIPGDGAALLRAFRDWVKSRRGIKVAGFAPDLDVDERVWTLAERIGFPRRGGCLLMFN